MSLDGVLDVESSRLELIEYLQSIEAEPHVMATWEKKLPFHRIANGDRLAIDLSTPGLESVVYIVHDPYDTPGSKLGVDFQDFLARWSALGCPGPERWLWEAFCEGQDSIMDPNGTNAALWRQAIGLNL